MRGYKEDENGDIILTMSKDDYQWLFLALGIATGAASKEENDKMVHSLCSLMERLNKGNPHN